MSNQNERPSLKTLAAMVVAFAVITSAGLGSYMATSSASSKTTSLQSESNRLVLVEAMNAAWNSSLSQPRFYVLGPHGLESSANIAVPVDTLIQVTIISYDTPTPGGTDQMGVVQGTVGGNVYVVNGTTASMGSMPEAWGQNVTSVPGAYLAHTFTIQALGVSIPVIGGDTEVAYLYFTKTGTYTWICLTPCGFGPNSMGGAMSESGWMAGQLTVS